MTDTVNLTNHFLIAMPSLDDPNFYHSVTYICEHSEQGALGLVINRQTDISLGEVLSQMDLEWPEQSLADQIVLLGGPIEQERGFILHSPAGDWDSSIRITDDLALTTSLDILEAISEGYRPDRLLITLGYAGWTAGQLEQEMVANAWLTGPADPKILFDLPIEQRWEAAARSVGVDLSRLSSDAGHD
ncbi:MAG: YqgE/AlgH family protein [Gammaproteobacteria bacterium]|nr:YqgE/AlgH family protein [Gammaproteobacteria bacterium]